MRTYKIICLLLFISIPLFAQDNAVIKIFEGNVEYISSQFIYVQFGNTDGLKSGDTLFTKKKGRYIPKLIIKSLSSRSCATIPIDKPLGVGTEVFGFRKIDVPADLDSNKIKRTIEPKIDNIVKVDTAEFIGFKELNKGLYGRFSISGYSTLSNQNSQRNYQNWRYSLSLNADNINNGKFSFSNYISFKYRADDWDYISSNIDDALRIYDLALRYDFTSSTNVLFGRKINRKISNIGAVDGLQLETKYKQFSIGGILGSRPDYLNYGYNLDLLQFGGYVSCSDSIGNGTMQNTIAVIQQMNDSKTDRRFLYFQHNNNIFNKTSLFLSSEIDLFEKINNKPNDKLKFTSLYLSLRYSPVRWLSTSLSYDARKNVIYYETFKNYADQLIESALRQGFRFRVNLRPIKYVFASIYTGYRFRESDVRPTRNFGGSVTHSRIPYLNLSANVSILNLSTNYLEGNIYGARFSKDLFNGLIYSTLGYRRVDYNFTPTQHNLIQDIVQLDFSLRLNNSITFSLSFEGTYEETISYTYIYANLSTRF